MKRILLFVGIITIALSLNCCQKRGQHTTGIPAYEALYKDSMETILHRLAPPYTHEDTVYTEMYIALKAMSKSHDNRCARLVCEKVDELISIDTSKFNQIHYLEAKLIALGALKDKQGIRESSLQLFNLYPENSIERLSSLGMYYLSTHDKDSADFYLNKCLIVSMEDLNSEHSETIEESIYNVLQSLVLLNKDNEAKSFIKEQLNNSHPDEIKDFLRSVESDYEGFKREAWEMIREY